MSSARASLELFQYDKFHSPNDLTFGYSFHPLQAYYVVYCVGIAGVRIIPIHLFCQQNYVHKNNQAQSY